MHALQFDTATRFGLARRTDAPEPVPRAHEALIAVEAISLNWGEVRHLQTMHEAGDVPGWDAAGVVLSPAEDGSGPPRGSRVVTFGWGGAWAARRAASTEDLAVVPASVELAAAVTLPVAAVTALRALRASGDVRDRRVLVTGASGGVGHFAVQLAAGMGAHVIAAVGSPSRGRGLTEIGAAQIVHGEDLAGLDEDVDIIIDNVGGQVLGRAMGRLREGGIAQAVGSAATQPLVLDLEAQRRRVGNTCLRIMVRGGNIAEDLSTLVDLLATGQLHPHIGLRTSWNDVDAAIDALLSRRVAGKVVLDLTP